jgi:hypothetical protein
MDAIERKTQELRKLAGVYAKAEAERTYLEEFKKSKLSILMKGFELDGITTAAGQEREARAHPDYLDLLKGLRDATEAAEKARWELKIAELGAELWRTREASIRAEKRAYGT